MNSHTAKAHYKQKLALIFTTLIFGMTSVGCTSTVKTGEVGMRTSFGKLVQSEQPGLHFHTPIKGRIHKINLRSQSISIPIPAYSKDSQIAPNNKVQVTFSLLETEATRVFERYGKNYIVSQVEPRVANIFREEFGTRNTLQIVQNRQELNNAVRTRLTQELKHLGLDVEAVNISIKFSSAFEKVAEESAIARSQANKAEQELQRVEFEEQQKLTRAEADKQVKVLEAQAQAESIRLQTEQLNRNPQYIQLLEAQTKLKAAENWNGQLPNYMGNSAIPFIQLPQSSNQTN